MTFRERGTRPEPQTHTLTFETYDLMWERGAQRGGTPKSVTAAAGARYRHGTQDFPAASGSFKTTRRRRMLSIDEWDIPHTQFTIHTHLGAV